MALRRIILPEHHNKDLVQIGQPGQPGSFKTIDKLTTQHKNGPAYIKHATAVAKTSQYHFNVIIAWKYDWMMDTFESETKTDNNYQVGQYN